MKKTNYSAFRLSIFSCTMLFFLLPCDSLVGQCSEPDILTTYECEVAPLICLQNWCTESSDLQNQGFNNFCGNNTVVNNPQYYAFMALQADVEFHIRIDYCNSGSQFALQAALLGSCPWTLADVIDCDPGTPPGGTIYLHSFGSFLPGQVYYLLIDGSNGSICGYTITHASGIYTPELVEEITTITATPSSVVAGFDLLTVEADPPVIEAHGYYWILGWSGDTITSTDPITEFYLDCDVPPGIYTICTGAFTGCDTTENEVCTEIEVLPLVDIIKPTSIFCAEEFPFEWNDTIITGPGTYVQSFESPAWCFYDSIWQITAYPEVAVGMIDTAVCQYGFLYEGQFYDSPGTYDIYYAGGSLNGCDSLVELHLSLDELNFFVEAYCLDSQYLLRPHVLEHFLQTDSIFYSWYDCTYDSLLSTSLTFTPDSAGCYCLVTDHGFCSDTICSTYLPAVCSQTCSLVQERACTGDSVLFTSGREFPPGTIYHWLIDRPGSPQQYYTGTDSLILDYTVPGCYAASLTIVSADSTFSCRDSVCVYSPIGSAALCCDQSVCDTCATITVDLSGTSPWTLYFSEGATIDTISDVRTSPYFHIVCPPADSTFIYHLTVIDSASQCPITISEEDHVAISLVENPVYSIIQNDDTLCVDRQDMAGYNWTGCASGQLFATTPCFIPPSSGCYCVEVIAQNGCTTTQCYDFILSSIAPIFDSDILISPIPSKGVFDIQVSAKVDLPAKWTLVDTWGRGLETGNLSQQRNTIRLRQIPPSGLYYLKIQSATNQSILSKVIIEAP